MLGWIAERYPDLIRRIKDQGHEVACHSYDHRLIYNMTLDQFREDIRKSKKILEAIVGEEVIGYRAPSYSITNESLWALEILDEERPDLILILITGDMIGFKGPFEPAISFLHQLRPRLGVYAVMGNTEYSNENGSCMLCHKEKSKGGEIGSRMSKGVKIRG